MPVTLQIALAGLIGTVLTTGGALAGSWYATRTTAKQSELNELRERVDDLTRENIQYHKENLKLREYIFDLRLKLAEHGIDVAPFDQWSSCN
jgi:chromosome segregation ATPase